MFSNLFRLYNLAFGKYQFAPPDGIDAPPLRMGILGAADIAPSAVIRPAKVMPGKVQIYSVAARDPARAKAFAKKYSIPHTHDSYDAMIVDPNIDVVYIPLPNGLHYEWSLKCIENGKPVLLEKPATSNAEQAEKLFKFAKEKNVLVVEAFHWWFHPAAKFVKGIISDKEVFGEPELYEGHLTINHLFNKDDIRFKYSLAGGSLMDVGCYPISWMRYFMGEEPIAAKKIALEVLPSDPKIDSYTKVEFSFASSDKKKGVVNCGLKTPYLAILKAGLVPNLTITSSKKKLVFTVPIVPHIYHNISITDLETGKIENKTFYEEGKETWGTYTYQLEAFADAVRGVKALFSNEDSVANMKAIDLAYQAVGLPARV